MRHCKNVALTLVCVTVNAGISDGCVCLKLGIGGEVWAETIIILVFPAKMCAYVCICDSVQKNLHVSV